MESVTTTFTSRSMTTRVSVTLRSFPTRRVPPRPGSSPAPAGYFAGHGIQRIERVITDNAFAYRNSTMFRQAVADLGAVQRFIKPHCPWTNGKAERFNRTLQTEWAYRQVFTSSTQRQTALAPWLQHYNTERIHTGIGTTPITRVSPT